MNIWNWICFNKKPKKTSFDHFINTLQEDMRTFHYLRYGQVLMHTLRECNREKYDAITGTEDDCFYDNGKVSQTLNKLEKEWTT